MAKYKVVEYHKQPGVYEIKPIGEAETWDDEPIFLRTSNLLHVESVIEIPKLTPLVYKAVGDIEIIS